MLATFAFDVCHDVYRAAREVLDTKIPTSNLDRVGKYQWHPDRVPHLAEYVSDFARAGQRAIEGTGRKRKGPRRKGVAAGDSSGSPLRASRMVMFRVFYLGGADYDAARRHLGICELTWADWAEEIRLCVGQELVRAGIFPPAKYFREAVKGDSPDRQKGGAKAAA